MHTSTSTDAPRWLVVCAAAVWLVVVIGMGLTRSGWVDELFIVFATDPAAPLQTHVAIWRTEPHPPIYTALVWAWRLVLDAPHLFTLRAFGIVVSALLAAGALAYWRAANWPGLGGFALLLFSAPALLFFPQEARSYFLSAFGGVYAALFLMRAFEAEELGAPTWADGAVGVIAAGLLGTHLMSFAFECLLFGIAVVAMVHQRRWAWLRLTLLIGVLVTGPIVIMTGVAIHDGMSRVLSSFWITRRQLLDTVLRLPWMVGVPVLAGLSWAVWRRRDLAKWREQAALGVVLAVAASVFALGCMSLVKPMLVVRYLVAPAAALIAPAAILVAALGPNALGAPIRSAIALVLCFATGLTAVEFSVRRPSDWRRPADAVSSIPSCRGAIVPYLIFNHPPGPGNVWRPYFEWYAPNHRFIPATPEALHAASMQACPVRLWIAHQERRNVPDEYRAAVRETCAAGRRVGLAFADGYLVVDADARAVISSWPGRSVPCSELQLDSE